jgi:hypothetical protein
VAGILPSGGREVAETLSERVSDTAVQAAHLQDTSVEITSAVWCFNDHFLALSLAILLLLL